jgi:hypothetical protein
VSDTQMMDESGTDAEGLLRGWRQGRLDERVLYAAVRGPMYQAARSGISSITSSYPDPHDVEDAVYEAFVQLCQGSRQCVLLAMAAVEFDDEDVRAAEEGAAQLLALTGQITGDTTVITVALTASLVELAAAVARPSSTPPRPPRACCYRPDSPESGPGTAAAQASRAGPLTTIRPSDCPSAASNWRPYSLRTVTGFRAATLLVLPQNADYLRAGGQPVRAFQALRSSSSVSRRSSTGAG